VLNSPRWTRVVDPAGTPSLRFVPGWGFSTTTLARQVVQDLRPRNTFFSVNVMRQPKMSHLPEILGVALHPRPHLSVDTGKPGVR
jgi:hypothetical protein